jgi:LysR family transcriptional regulator, nitrogen assimilation regulatory protein
MELASLKLFVTVAELGSISRAAVALDTVQSSISRQIGALEKEFGAQLFHRTGRGVSLTLLGERILPRVRGLLQSADALVSEVKSDARRLIGYVQLGLLPSVARLLVPSLYDRIRSLHPGIRLRIYEGSGGQLEEWLSLGTIDLAIHYRDGREVTKHSQVLAAISAYLVGPANDPLTKRSSIKFERLNGLPLVLPGPPSGLRSLLSNLSRRKKIAIAVVLEADSMAIQTNVARRGLAYTILGLHSVHSDIKVGNLQAAKIIEPTVDQSIVLSTTTSHPLTAATKEVAAFAKELLKSELKKIRA